MRAKYRASPALRNAKAHTSFRDTCGLSAINRKPILLCKPVKCTVVDMLRRIRTIRYNTQW